jgi:hypothetical protein
MNVNELRVVCSHLTPASVKAADELGRCCWYFCEKLADSSRHCPAASHCTTSSLSCRKPLHNITTLFSALLACYTAGDLDPSTSQHHLVSLKAALPCRMPPHTITTVIITFWYIALLYCR